jgi:hypothetical protein
MSDLDTDPIGAAEAAASKLAPNSLEKLHIMSLSLWDRAGFQQLMRSVPQRMSFLQLISLAS